MSLIQRVLELAVQIQQVPAPTFEEQARAQFVLDRFRAEGLTEIAQDAAGNVYARYPGRGSAAPLVVSAHLDTVFPAETDLSIRREPGRLYGPGLGDNSMGVAGLFGLLWQLRERALQLPGDLWLVANTAEEGLGDLKGMKAVCDRFGSTARAYLIIEGMALGHVYHRGTGVRRYKITLHTPGGHSWIDYGKPSAIHELARLVAQISDLSLPANPRTTLNIGRISGGTSINTIAPNAWIELDLRSESADELNHLIRQVEKLVAAVERPQRGGDGGVRVELEVIGQRPAGEISTADPLIKLAKSILMQQGLDPLLTIGSTDANIPLSRGYPALVLGITRGGGAHTVGEFIETEPVADGLEQLLGFVSGVWGSQ